MGKCRGVLMMLPPTMKKEFLQLWSFQLFKLSTGNLDSGIDVPLGKVGKNDKLIPLNKHTPLGKFWGVLIMLPLL